MQHADFDHRMLNPAADSSPSRPTIAADRTDTCLTVREVLSSNMFAAIGSPEQWCCQSVSTLTTLLT